MFFTRWQIICKQTFMFHLKLSIQKHGKNWIKIMPCSDLTLCYPRKKKMKQFLLAEETP